MNSIITQDTRQPTETDRLSDYYAKPAAIERRMLPVMPWDRVESMPVTQLPEQKDKK